ncbi:MAG: non-homologous end-joining DNA ligase [Actinomycetota bacterium]
MSLINLSSPDKLLFPADGITKAEVFGYYQKASPRMLSHVVDRPITLERYPQGIEGEGFMQKNAGTGFPAFIGRVELPKEGGMVNYPSISDLDGLLYLANQNTITFHIPCFHASDLDHPDRLVFDLDPTEGDLDGARFGAKAVKEMLAEVEVPSWVMTTGSKGFHVVVPLTPTIDFDSLGRFAQAVAVLLAHRHPDRLTVEFLKKERQGRVFVDWLRNHFGATGVSPYSLRPKASAPIAMPIKWTSLGKVVPNQFNIRDAAKHLSRDSWEDIEPQDIAAAVTAFESLIREKSIELPTFDRFGR